MKKLQKDTTYVIRLSSQLKVSLSQNEILDRFLPYEARAEIYQKFGWSFGRFEDTKISF